MANTSTSNAARFLPLLVLLFVGSGCAALIYEIVWLQLLQLVIGSSAFSLGVLLGTFMGGMCLGSLLLPKLANPNWHPLVVYSILELGIAACGLVLLLALPAADEFYSAIASRGWGGIVVRGLIAALCLLPPTMCMGATLPAIGRWVESTPRGYSWLGFFYGGNIAGAVVGCLTASFFLLRLYDVSVATWAAAALNVSVAVIGLFLAYLLPYSRSELTTAASVVPSSSSAYGVYLAIGLSGLGALGAEIMWTRQLSLLLGGTVYTFSIILAVFLIGLGIGSCVASFLIRDFRSPRLLLGICQFSLSAAIAWAAVQLALSLPYWPIDPSNARSPWDNFQLDLIRCLWAVLPAAILWGASFPLALSAIPTRDLARTVGAVYGANTIGAICGALLFSIFLIGAIGSQRSQQLLIVIAVAAGTFAIAPLLIRQEPGDSAGTAFHGSLLTAAIFACLVLAYHVPPTPGDLIAHGRRTPTRAQQYSIVYQGEGTTSSVAVTLFENVRNFHVSGKIEASSEPHDMRLQRMLGHIPALVHSQPKSVLVVGCGAGVTAGSFLTHPSVERIVICEIEPLIPRVVARFFAKENYGVATHPRVEIVYDDARHFILTTREKFDVITSDPINPWVKGAATLYTREYFELCKSRLNVGGVISQWVPLYESNVAAVQSELATFFHAFPEGTVWSNDFAGQGYDLVLLGQVAPLVIDVEKLQERLGNTDHFPVDESLYEVGFHSGVELLATFAGTAADLKTWLAAAEINHDRNLRLQYLAGQSAHSYTEGAIFEEILQHRTFPESLFIASAAIRENLRQRFRVPGR